MIRLGVSTACLYPEVTESAVKIIAKQNIDTIEIFFNSPSEFSPSYIRKLKEILDTYGVTAVSMHPFSSFSEPYMFFTDYERRFTDQLEQYKQYFDRMNLLGSRIFVFHGDRHDSKFPHESYFERFALLSAAGRQQGIIVAQENVARCKSREISFIRAMRAYLKDDVHFVLDLKQAVRAGVSPLEMLDAMDKKLVHLHLNDHTMREDCLLPGRGIFDFVLFFQKIKALRYSGAALIEVYRQNFGAMSEIAPSLAFLQKALETAAHED